MESYKIIIEKFDSLFLEETLSVNLFERVDTKFVFGIDEFTALLKELQPNYKLVAIGEKKISRYKTTYFDTPNFTFYNQHHQGKLNRYKVRQRTYIENDLSFLEIKHKTNKGRTLKTRTLIEKNNANVLSFLDKKFLFDGNTLDPKITISYSRITLVNLELGERITFDLDLEFETGEHKKLFSSLVIAEVKQNKKKTSLFIKLMQKKHIQQTPISKYCMGIATLYNSVKKNNFKPQLLKINKLT
jgi:hypothetical protein